MSVYIETGFNGDNYPLTHPRIGYVRRGAANAAASSEASGFAAVNAGTVRTDSAWRPTSLPGSAANWNIVFNSPRTVGYFGVAKHDLATQNAEIRLQTTSDGGATWDGINGFEAITPTDNSAILFLFDPVTVDGIRLRINSADDNPTIATMGTGEVMEWPQPCTWTGTPITEGDQITFSVNRTDTGNWVGRTKVSDGLQYAMAIENLSETFRSGDFADFKAYANGEDATFWVASRPGDYPDEVAYAWALDVVRMERARPNATNAGAVTLNLQGLRVND